MKPSVSLFWFRRDLRLHDNAGLYHALKSGTPILPIFIFDRHILDQLEEKADARVQFIRDSLSVIQEKLVKEGVTLEVYYGFPDEVFSKLLSAYQVVKVFANHDYEPYARERDAAVAKRLQQEGIPLFTFKDQVIFEKDEILKEDGKPYTIFTPYSKKWRAQLTDFTLRAYPVEKYLQNFYRQEVKALPSLSSMGFSASELSIPPGSVKKATLEKYAAQRDYPGIMGGMSRIGIH
ncbi:MAG: deoxyribodipyrimidine photo-lyase, partial [Bacteroidota bacterium]